MPSQSISRRSITPSGNLTHPALFSLTLILGFGLGFFIVKAGPPPSGSTCTFTQLVSTDWNTGNNWSCTTAADPISRIPTADDAVVIPKDKKVEINDPTAGGWAFSLQVGLSATVNVNSGLLTIAEATTNKGSISAAAAKDSAIYFGFNVPDSVTTNESGAFITINVPASSTASGGNLSFFNHFLNKGELRSGKGATIGFQRDWTQTDVGRFESAGVLSGEIVRFFGDYEQVVNIAHRSTGENYTLTLNILSIDKDPRTVVDLAIGSPTSKKDFFNIFASDHASFDEVHLNSGILRARDSIIQMVGLSVMFFVPSIWQNAGGEFDGGSGVVVFGGCYEHKIIGTETGFNHILFIDPDTPETSCFTVSPILTVNAGNIGTNTIDIPRGILRLGGNNLLVRNGGMSSERPLRSSVYGKGRILVDPLAPSKEYVKEYVSFSAAVPTELDPVINYFPNLSFSGSGPFTLPTTKVENSLNVSSGATVNIMDGKALTVIGPFNNDGLIVPGIGSNIIHPANYAKFTDALGTPVLSYTAPDTVYIEVKDTDRNLDGTVAETITQTITASSGGVEKDKETVTLTETGPNTGVFRGSIPFVQVAPGAAVIENGSLEMDSFGSANFTYVDPLDLTDTAKDFVPLNLP